MNEDVLGHLPTPDVPLLYLDWNIVHYLRHDDRFLQLVDAITTVHMQRAAILPFSVAHLMDATALWGLHETQRSRRYRDMVHLDGVSQGLMWRLPECSVTRTTVLSEAERYGFTTTTEDLRRDAPDLVADAEDTLRTQLETVRTEIECAPNVPETLRAAMLRSLEDSFDGGLPDVASAGRLQAHTRAPLFDPMAELMPPIQVGYEHAVEAVRQRLDGFGMSFDGLLKQATQDGTDPDVLGPILLGEYGFHRDSRRSVTRRRPGFMVDAAHTPYALASNVFVSSDRRFTERLRAWAHHTKRGPEHGAWPLILTCRPDHPDDVATTERIVRGIAAVFEGRVDEWRQRRLSSGA